MKKLLVLLPALLFLFSCNHSSGAKPVTEKPAVDSASVAVKPDAPKKEIVTDSLLQVYVAYMAGMDTANKTGISEKLRSNSFYKKYVAGLDSNFAKMDKDRLSKMRTWAKTELSKELAEPRVLFYPFSGPDALHALTFYPNAKEYVMVAMERYGSVPDFSKMDSAKAAYYLNSVNESLGDIFEKSYFITRKMVTELQKEKVNGVTPLICLFLQRTGHRLVAIHKMHLNDDGTTVELAADSLPSHVNDFIEIYFRDTDSSELRKITYFRANLGNEKFGGLPSLTDNKTLQNYFNSLPEFYCYTKSASYLMNYGNFSTIRNICLAKSISVLQDDTGIGYEFFDSKIWNMKLYGRYVKPVSDFKWVFDTKLAEAYKTDSANVKPLTFSLGYHWGNRNDQNLIKAERK